MKSNYKPWIMAVSLIVVGLGSRVWLTSNSTGAVTEVRGSLAEGGQSTQSRYAAIIGVAQAEDAAANGSAALVQNGETSEVGGASDVVSAFGVMQATVQDLGQPVGPDLSGSQNIQYTVKKGDTLSDVAAHFNVSADSIVSANPNIRKKSLKLGEIITISYTPSPASSASALATNLPNFNGDFVMPSQGYNEGKLASDNSIDIENSCGTPVIAAADGVVVPDANISNTAGGWNDGYGSFILIQHPFGNEIFTRYAHLEQTLVGIGDYVKQGQEVGLIGQTGSASQCELGFEVMGAQNPFAH